MKWLLKFIPGFSMIQWALIGGAACLAIGGTIGYKFASGSCAKAQLKAVEAAIEEYQKQEEQNRKVEIKYIEKEGKERIVYRDRIKEVVKYVQNTTDIQCFNDDGLQLYRQALAGTETTSQPAR